MPQDKEPQLSSLGGGREGGREGGRDIKKLGYGDTSYRHVVKRKYSGIRITPPFVALCDK